MPPGTVLVGPACRRPTTSLPHLPFSLPHLVTDTGPRCRPAPSVSRVARALPCSPARLHRERALPPLIALPRAIPTPRSAVLTVALGALSLSRFPSSTRHQADPPPPIFLSCSPSRARQFGEADGISLRSVLCPDPSSSSPPSPPPTRPPRRLLPPETPPPL
jgi:hypothetical protein